MTFVTMVLAFALLLTGVPSLAATESELLAAAVSWAPVDAQPQAKSPAQLVHAALELLDDLPGRVAISDPLPGRPYVPAFVIEGDERRTVYLVRTHRFVKDAGKGDGIRILAATIAHEVSHLNGADEVEAQLVEVEAYRRFVDDGLVTTEPGRQHLLDLEMRNRLFMRQQRQ